MTSITTHSSDWPLLLQLLLLWLLLPWQLLQQLLLVQLPLPLPLHGTRTNWPLGLSDRGEILIISSSSSSWFSSWTPSNWSMGSSVANGARTQASTSLLPRLLFFFWKRHGASVYNVTSGWTWSSVSLLSLVFAFDSVILLLDSFIEG